MSAGLLRFPVMYTIRKGVRPNIHENSYAVNVYAYPIYDTTGCKKVHIGNRVLQSHVLPTEGTFLYAPLFDNNAPGTSHVLLLLGTSARTSINIVYLSARTSLTSYNPVWCGLSQLHGVNPGKIPACA
jgi:hypothetical protein